MSILKKNTNQQQQRRRGGEGGASSRRRRARTSSTAQDEGLQRQHHDERHVKFPTPSNGDEDQVLTNVVSIIEPVAEGERAILWYTVSSGQLRQSSFWTASSALPLPLQIGS